MLSGKEHKKRQQVLYAKLHEGFSESPGEQARQMVVLHYLNLCHSQDDKSLCTTAVKRAFGSANVKRVRRMGEEMYPFRIKFDLGIL